MKDRISLYPGRVQLNPVSGMNNVYDVVRADEPLEEGTPLNKNNLLKDTTANLYGMNDEATPDNVFEELHKSMDKIGNITPTTNRSLEEDYLWCDGSVVSEEEYPDLYNMLLPNGSELAHTLSGSTNSNLKKCSFLKHVNGYLITNYYCTLWYKADTEETWHSISWQNLSNDNYHIYPVDVVWDDINNKFVFFCYHNNRGNKIYTTSDLSILPTYVKLIGTTDLTSMHDCKKVGQYWVVKVVRNSGLLFYYTEDLLNGTWISINDISSGILGLSQRTDIVYVNGRYIICGGMSNPQTTGSSDRYCLGYAYTDVGGTINGPWHIVPVTDNKSSLTISFKQVLYLPKRKMYFFLYSDNDFYYSYNITEGAKKLSYYFSNAVPSTGGEYPAGDSWSNIGVLINDVVYYSKGVILDVENLSGEPIIITSCTPALYPKPYLTDNLYYYACNTNQIFKLHKTTPNLLSSSSDVLYKIKARGVYK